jgi:hypothetical protein
MHDFGLSHAQEFGTTLGKVPYEVPEGLTGLLGARPQVPQVFGTHVRALEVPHERANQIVPVVDLTRRQVFEPRPSEYARCSGRLRMITSSVVAPPSW